MSIGQMTMGIITIVLAVIIAVAGATWVISEKINASHVELLEENAKTRDELRKEIGVLRNEFHKNMGDIREEINNLRRDVENIDTKVDEFKDSHEREHDLFYDAAAKDDEEISTSAN